MNKSIFLFLIVITIFIGGIGFFISKNSQIKPVTKPSKTITIGLSWDTLREERWQKDLDLFMKYAKEKGASVVVKSANSDPQLQISQAENLISQGVDVLVIVPYDSKSAAQIVDKAHQAKIKTLSYDRLIRDSDVDYYVSFDNEKVGEMEATGVLDQITKGNIAYVGGAPTDNNSKLLRQGAMKILEPKITKGDIKLIFDQFTLDWKPEEAYKNIKQLLDSGKKIDGVIAANDGTAFGVIRALQEKGLAGKVPVSGQDAELAACQRVVQGTQIVTVYKPIPEIAKKAVDMAISMAKNQTVDTNAQIENGYKNVPSYLITPIAVTKANMNDTIIKDGYHSSSEVYKTQK